MSYDRTKYDPIAYWWWNVDRVFLGGILLLMLCGVLFVYAASPPVAERAGLDSFYFFNRQLVFIAAGLFVLFISSFFSVKFIKFLGIIGCVIGLLSLLAVLQLGDAAKGARRWLDIAGNPVQPSEFMKPVFAIVSAYILTHTGGRAKLHQYAASFSLLCIIVGLLLMQPDLGMAITFCVIWAAQAFMVGLPYIVIAILVGLGVMGLITLYNTLPHVAQRIDMFLQPEAVENYQLMRSLQAFASGGWFGRGTGEGVVKSHIPDSHTDFILAVVGEEFGILVCIILVMIYLFVIMRGLIMIKRIEDNPFMAICSIGILTQIGFQAAVNIMVNIGMAPTKGMTLPFISYGGSSMIALCFGVAIIVAATKKIAKNNNMMNYQPYNLQIR